MATPLPSKKEVLLGLLEKTSVLVHLDARRDEVKVPKHLKTNPQLILQLGLNLAVPIRDLDVSDEGVSCTLSFARTPFFCVLPYTAIFAIVSDDGKKAMVWPEDVPAEVARAAEDEAKKLGLIKPADRPPEPPAPRIEIGQRAPKRPAALKAEREPNAPLKLQPEPKPRPKPKPIKPRAEPERPKRELPPYLRVIK